MFKIFKIVWKLISKDTNTSFSSRDFNIVKFIRVILISIITTTIIIMAYRSVSLSMDVLQDKKDIIKLKAKIAKCKK